MPRRRRKYRPPQQEQEKTAAPFFAKTRKEETVVQTSETKTEKPAAIDQAQQAVLELLHRLKSGIKESHLEFAFQQQSKAVALAGQMMAENIWDIQYVQQTLKDICETVRTGHFVCSHHIGHAFGESGTKTIRLGHAFLQKNRRDQAYHLLREAIKLTHLPIGDGMPSGRYENTDPAAEWADYIIRLYELLPERPYLITGTPTNNQPPKPLIVEEETIEEPVGEEAINDTPADEEGEEGLLPQAISPPPIDLAASPEEERFAPPKIEPVKKDVKEDPTTKKKASILGRIRNWLSPKK